MKVSFKLKGEANEVVNFINILKHVGTDAQPVLHEIGKGALIAEKVALGAASSPLARTILTGVNPVLGSLVPVLAGAILNAQETHGTTTSPATGEAKKTQVLSLIEAVSPIILELLVARTGHTVVDEAKFARGISELTDGLVSVFQGIGTIPPKVVA